MNAITITIRFACWLSVVSFLLTGCVKRELEMRPTQQEGYAQIALDWGEAAESPQSARYLFYDQQGVMVKEVSGCTTGFQGVLPVGKYQLVVHNQDAQKVDYRGLDRYSTAEIFAQQIQPTQQFAGAFDLTPLADRSACYIEEPRQVYGIGRSTEYEILEITVGDTLLASVRPKQLTREVEFHFLVESEVSVSSFDGVLNGVAQGIFISSAKHNPEISCSIEFAGSLQAKADSKEYMSRMSVFNLLTTAQSPDLTNSIDVELNLVDGREFRARVDLTPTLKQIIIDNNGEIPIEIPIEVTFLIVGVNMTATVKPWDESGTGGGDPRPQGIVNKK